MSSPDKINSTSLSEIFEDQVIFLLNRRALSFESLLQSFQEKYRYQHRGALSDALIKSAQRIISRSMDNDVKKWAGEVIEATKSSTFSTWCKNQKDQNPRRTVEKVGRQYVNRTLGRVGKAMSEMTEEVIRSGMSQAFDSGTSSPMNEGLKKQKLNSGQPILVQDYDDDGEDDDQDGMDYNGVCTPLHLSTADGMRIPLVDNMAAEFLFVDEAAKWKEQLSETNLELLNSSTRWFLKLTAQGIDEIIASMQKERFSIAWIHDLLYDRLRMLRRGVPFSWDENTYTSMWVNLDLSALYTGVNNLISFGFVNENPYAPSAWRRSLVRNNPNSKGTNVDGYYAGIDGSVDFVFENVGSPGCTTYTKKLEDEQKCWRNSADALLQRFYLSTGSFEIAKEYNVISMVVYGLEVSLYITSIAGVNSYKVKKIFQDRYHTNKDVYLAKILVHVKLCLLIKSIMERNQDVASRFNDTIDSDSLLECEQACYNMKLHVTPSKKLARSSSTISATSLS
ncbi:hypothetical protein BGZ79_001984 [Entomortierella chlamydospora]|nr:hypothetical protein BGZ79_001984 [Entomortierella chlamydospora]